MTDESGAGCDLGAVGVKPQAAARSTVVFGIVAAALIGLMAAMAWLTYYRALTLDQPLSITACDPATYDFPVGTERGPDQSDCVRVFTGRGDTHLASDPIRVAGQVCLEGEDSVAYRVEVAFVPVLADQVRIIVLDVPITYDPGCQEPYDFAFEFPSSFFAELPSGESLGDWRVVGTARPLRSGYEPYVWDATSTVELVAP